MAPTQRPVFDSYALPLPRRREGAGPAAVLSFIAHLTIAVLVLWRGAALFESGGGGGTGPRGGGGGGGRPAVSWFTLPSVSTPQAHDIPQPPAVSVPTVAVPVTEPVKIDVPLPNVVIAPPAAIGTGTGTTGGPGQGPGTGGGTGTGAGTGAGADTAGSGGGASDILPASPFWVSTPPDAPPEARGQYEVRFWVSAQGKVTRVEVTPVIKNSAYRRGFMQAMWGYRFIPAKTREGRPIDSVALVKIKL